MQKGSMDIMFGLKALKRHLPLRTAVSPIMLLQWLITRAATPKTYFWIAARQMNKLIVGG